MKNRFIRDTLKKIFKKALSIKNKDQAIETLSKQNIIKTIIEEMKKEGIYDYPSYKAAYGSIEKVVNRIMNYKSKYSDIPRVIEANLEINGKKLKYIPYRLKRKGRPLYFIPLELKDYFEIKYSKDILLKSRFISTVVKNLKDARKHLFKLVNSKKGILTQDEKNELYKHLEKVKYYLNTLADILRRSPEFFRTMVLTEGGNIIETTTDIIRDNIILRKRLRDPELLEHLQNIMNALFSDFCNALFGKNTLPRHLWKHIYKIFETTVIEDKDGIITSIVLERIIDSKVDEHGNLLLDEIVKLYNVLIVRAIERDLPSMNFVFQKLLSKTERKEIYKKFAKKILEEMEPGELDALFEKYAESPSMIKTLLELMPNDVISEKGAK